MALLPYYFYDIDQPLRMMERNLFRTPNQPRDFCSPSWEIFQPLKQFSEAMNCQDTANDEDFQITVDVQHFTPEEIHVKVVNRQVIVEGKHEEKRDQHGYVSRQFVRKYTLPKGYLPDTVQSKLSSDGVLIVSAPKVLPMPSAGEKIIPITKTGPARKHISAAGGQWPVASSKSVDNHDNPASSH
ncbi:Small heat shock protein [Operophtera brumata]|uniref:Small heat shock protein n=1 Tax=Operophtera brumata TaxID=104452 RepID=A0A0L7LQ76_OPEBR|nr:Small heat shock protein [Operophtera brumata]